MWSFSDTTGKPLGTRYELRTHIHTRGDCSSPAQLQPQQHTWANWAEREFSQHPKDFCLLSVRRVCASPPFPCDLEPLLHWWSDKVIDGASFLSLPHPNSQPIHPSPLGGGKRWGSKWWMSMENFSPALCSFPKRREVKGIRGGWVTWWSERRRDGQISRPKYPPPWSLLRTHTHIHKHIEQSCSSYHTHSEISFE